MSISTQIFLNNLQREINQLKAVEGLTNPLSGDVSGNNKNITNIQSIGLKDAGDNGVNKTLTINDSVIKIDDVVYGGVSNPLASSLDCNSHAIENVSSIAFAGQSSSVYLDGALITFTHDVGFGNNNISSIGEVSCNNIELNNSKLEWDGTNLSINNDDIIRASTINSYIDNEAEFSKLSIKDGANEYTIGVNSTNDLALYTGLSVNNSNLVGNILYHSPVDGAIVSIVSFEDASDSANHKLMLSDSTPYRLQIDDKKIMIEDDMTNYYSKDADINTQHDIYMNGHNIANVSEIGIGLAANKILTIDSDDDLTFDDNKIVTSANIAGYIDSSNIFQQIYKNSYLTDFNPSYTTYDMHIDLTPELAGATATLGYSIFIS
jgi:hypothetical protein